MNKKLPVLDLELGAKLINSDQKAAKTMLKDLAASLPKALQQLKSAYDQEDVKQVGNIAHYLHGGACYCGTPRLKEAAFQLERLARGLQPFQELESAYKNLCTEISAVIEKTKQAGI